MSVLERTYGGETSAVVDELLISSDSHVIEPEGLCNPSRAFTLTAEA